MIRKRFLSKKVNVKESCTNSLRLLMVFWTFWPNQAGYDIIKYWFRISIKVKFEKEIKTWGLNKNIYNMGWLNDFELKKYTSKNWLINIF